MSFSTVTVSSSRVRRSSAQSRPSRPGTLVASVRRPVSASTTPGTPTTAPSIRSAGSPLASASETPEAGDRVDRPLGVGAVELDVLPRADLAAQVADRAAQEARAQVEAEHEPRLGHDLEEGGAVGRPAGIGLVSRTRPASSSDWSASETVGFEIPARREISAREIGAPERIASSTVRSFRSFSSGGIAALRAIVVSELYSF